MGSLQRHFWYIDAPWGGKTANNQWPCGLHAPNLGGDTDLQNTALEYDLVYGHGLPWQGGGHWRRTLPVLTSCVTVR